MKTQYIPGNIRPLWLLLVAAALAGCQGATGPAPVELETATATYLAGDNDEAVRLYTGFLGRNPHSPFAPQAYLGRGNAYYRLAKYPQAEADFRQAAGSARDTSVKAQATLGLAHALFAQNRYPAAEKTYRRVLKNYTGIVASDEVMYRLGMALARQSKWDEAAARLNEVVAKWPSGEFARRASAKIASVMERSFTVQVGAFTSKALADKKAAELVAGGFQPRIQRINMDGVPGYAVRSGSFGTWPLACAHAAALENAGFSTYTLP